MKRGLALLLLLGAFLGLFAQEAAFASAMPIPAAAVAAPAMSDECAEMMGIEKSQDKGPCQSLTLDCIAKMGCALPPAVISPDIQIAGGLHILGVLDPRPVRRLAGRTFGPEPDPPLFPD